MARSHSLGSSLLCLGALGGTGAAALAQQFPLETYPTLQAPVQSIAGDVNGDGRPDVVVRNITTLQTLLGGANGLLQPGASGGSLSATLDFTFADVNLDGRLDLIATQSSPSRILVLTGNGAGAFAAPTVSQMTTIPGIAVRIEVADLQGIGRPDIVAVQQSRFSVLFHQPDFTYQLTQNSPHTYVGLSDVAIGDMDGNTTPDLVAIADGVVATHLNDGTGSLPQTALSFLPSLGILPVHRGVLSDVTDDGNLDLCMIFVDTEGAASLNVHAHNGGYSFLPPSLSIPTVVPNALATRDLNGDGRIDFVMTSDAAQQLITYLSTAEQGIAESTPVRTPISGTAGKLLLGGLEDLDLDGGADAVMTVQGQNSLLVVRREPKGDWVRPIDLPFADAGPELSLGDLDRDGAVEAAAINPGGSELRLLRGFGAGNFALASTVALPSPGTEVLMADLNQDDQLDVVVSSMQGGCGLFLLMGDGSGGAQLDQELSYFDNDGVLTSTAIADLDGDGFLDLASGFSLKPIGVGGRIVVSRGTSKGFEPPSIATAPASVGKLLAGDVDGDGSKEVLDVVAGSSQIHIWKQEGGALASMAPYVQNLMYSSSGALGDLNGDGRDDLLVSDPQKDSVWVALGAANGFLGAQQRSTGFVFGGGARIACADVDADGFRDALVALKTGAVMRGDGAGGLSKAIGAFGASIGDDHLVDFDADGALDLVGIDSEGRLATYLNLRVAPSSTAAVGYGTYGCWSQLGVTASQPPNVGSSAFRITATSAPRKSAGMLILADAGSELALDPFFLGVALHVDLMQAHQVAAAALFTDHVGTASAHLPIPNAPSLVNAHIWAQPLFAESVGYRCGSSPYHLTTGRAVKLTILP